MGAHPYPALVPQVGPFSQQKMVNGALGNGLVRGTYVKGFAPSVHEKAGGGLRAAGRLQGTRVDTTVPASTGTTGVHSVLNSYQATHFLPRAISAPPWEQLAAFTGELSPSTVPGANHALSAKGSRHSLCS